MKQETYYNYFDAAYALKNIQKTLGGRFVCRPDLKYVNGKFEDTDYKIKIGIGFPHWGYLLCEKQKVKISIKMRKSGDRDFYFDIKQVA